MLSAQGQGQDVNSNTKFPESRLLTTAYLYTKWFEPTGEKMQESAFLGRVAQYGSKPSGGDFGKSHSYRHYGECEEPGLMGQNMKNDPPFPRQARPSGPAGRASRGLQERCTHTTCSCSGCCRRWPAGQCTTLPLAAGSWDSRGPCARWA